MSNPIITKSLTDLQLCVNSAQSLTEYFGSFVQGYSRPCFQATFDGAEEKTHIIELRRNRDDVVLQTRTVTTESGVTSLNLELYPIMEADNYGNAAYSCDYTIMTVSATYKTGIFFNVIPYTPPQISVFQVTRYKYITSQGYASASDGGYIWMTLTAAASAMSNATNPATLGYSTDYATYTTISTGSNGLSYSIDERNTRTPSNAIFRSTISTGSDIPFYIRLTDKVTSVIATAWACADGAYFSVEKYGVAVGKRSEGTTNDKLFEVASGYRSVFEGGVVIGGDSMVSADLRICGDIRVDGDTRLCGNVQVAGILDFYPIGSIYISTINSNPANYFGGTWQAFGQGRMLIGAGTGTDANSVSRSFSANDTGGEYDHTLTINEIPSHRHSMDTGGKTVNKGTNYNRPTNATAYSSSHTYQTTYQGGDAAHNNMPPYIAAYMWVRTA